MTFQDSVPALGELQLLQELADVLVPAAPSPAAGIPKILQAMRQNGSPPPEFEFEFDEDHSYFMVRLPVHPAALEVAESGATGIVGGAESDLTPHVTPQVTPHVRRQLLDAMDGERTRAEIMAAMKLKDRMHFATVYLQPALEAGLIEMTIPDKPRSKSQKYRLTTKGRQYLKNGES